jgi:hypothetical protein
MPNLGRSKVCLADHGKHRWKYRDDSMLGRIRECQKCGLQQQRDGKRWEPLPRPPLREQS